jgi:hypothetical protein
MQFSYNQTYPPETPHAALTWMIVQVPRIGIPRKFRQRTPWTYPRLEVTTQGALRAVFPLTPPRPLLPEPKPWGRGGAKRLGASDGIVVDRSWGEWLFGFSPEGGTWTAISA